MPKVQTPPIRPDFSKHSKGIPRSARALAVASPLGPAPMMQALGFPTVSLVRNLASLSQLHRAQLSRRLSERWRKAGRCGVATRPLLRRRSAGEHGQTGLALTRMNATKHGVSLRLLQAWLVPRWTRASPARNNVSPSSMTAKISPDSTIA